MAIRAVLFDFGGVLVRTEDDSGRRKWEERLGLPRGALERLILESDVSVQAMVGRVPEEAVWQHVARTLGLNLAELDELRRDFWAGDRLDPLLLSFLHSLRPRYRTGLLSNAWSNARDVFTGKYGLGEVMDVLVISAEEGVMKPEARIYHIAVERLGVRPDEAVFVDDLAENVAGARKAGLHGIQFQHPEQVMAEVRRYLDGT